MENKSVSPPADPRQALDLVADALRGRRPGVNVGAAIKEQPHIAESLCRYIAGRFVEGTMPPSDTERDPVFWEAIATVLSRLDAEAQTKVVDLFFAVQDPRSLYHILAPLLREVFFPSMLEPVLLQKIQNDDPKQRENAKEMDYFLFQSRAHFAMTPEGRARFDALAAR